MLPESRFLTGKERRFGMTRFIFVFNVHSLVTPHELLVTLHEPNRYFSHQRETLAQVYASDFRIGCQLAGHAMTEDSSFVDDVGPVGDRQRLAHVVIRYQDSDAAGPQAADNFLQVEHGNRVYSRKRFIEQDKRGIDAEAAGDFHFSALAA